MSGIHTCSYYCTRPGCVLAQRDELRDKWLVHLEKKNIPSLGPIEVEALALDWHNQIDGKLLPRLTANELANLINEYAEIALAPRNLLDEIFTHQQPQPKKD